jgi:crotonobetainyl-CoA:carnitine CoA-transferase CaiB-like acyl-CoA transferase
MSRSPARLYKAPPALGEDNEEILQSLNFTRDEILKMRGKNVIP